MNQDKPELIPAEFRHDIVVNFIMDLNKRSIRVKHPDEYAGRNKKVRENMAQMYTDLLTEITNYCSGKVRGDDLDQLELDMFDIITFFNATDAIEDRYPTNKFKEDVRKLQESLDSTNRLLQTILNILNSIGETDENSRKS